MCYSIELICHNTKLNFKDLCCRIVACFVLARVRRDTDTDKVNKSCKNMFDSVRIFNRLLFICVCLVLFICQMSNSTQTTYTWSYVNAIFIYHIACTHGTGVLPVPLFYTIQLHHDNMVLNWRWLKTCWIIDTYACYMWIMYGLIILWWKPNHFPHFSVGYQHTTKKCWIIYWFIAWPDTDARD